MQFFRFFSQGKNLYVSIEFSREEKSIRGVLEDLKREKEEIKITFRIQKEKTWKRSISLNHLLHIYYQSKKNY